MAVAAEQMEQESPADASQFEGLWQAGAFDSQNPKEAEQLREEREAANQPPESAPDPKAAKEVPPGQKQDGKQPPEEEEGEEYGSLDEFLTKHKLDPNSFQSLPVTVKVDGQTRQVPLSDVIKGFQLEQHVTQRSQELSNQQRAFEAERQAAQNLYKQQLHGAQALAQVAHQRLLGEYQNINWDQLRATDPIQAAVKFQEFQQRNAEIQQHLSQLSQAQEADRQRSLQEQQANLPKERERLLESRPEWRDPAKFAAARDRIISYGRKMGFSEAELGSISDHRQLLLMDLAASHAALQASAPEALKRVRAAPQMAKPGARQGRDPNQVARQQAVERFNRNPNDLDAQAALFETLAG